MIQWQHFPKSDAPTPLFKQVVAAFESVAAVIDSSKHEHKSDVVLRHSADVLKAIGFRVEAGKRHADKLRVPVLFGKNGSIDKYFEADAFHEREGFVLAAALGKIDPVLLVIEPVR